MFSQRFQHLWIRIFVLAFVMQAICLSASAQVEELVGKTVTRVNATPTASFKEGQWYLMQNRGRAAYNYEKASEGVLRQSNAPLMAGDDITAENAGFLFQVVAASDDRNPDYYIMTGYGHWLCDITEDSQVARTTDDINQRAPFSTGRCAQSGHWWLKSASGYVLDGNGNGQTVVGYGTKTPTKVDGNNDHSFYAVTLGSADNLTGAALVNRQLRTGGLFRFASQRTTSMVMTDPASHKLVSQTLDKTNEAQWWLVQPLAGGGVALRNYQTGLYVQTASGGSTQYTTATGRATLYAKASPKATATKGLVMISSNANFADKSCLHDDASHKVVNWTANNTNGDNPCSDWNMTAVETMPTAEEVKDHFDEVGGMVRPADGITVQIRNVESGWQIGEDGSSRLLALEASTDDFSQYWVMESDGNGRYAFRNVKTGHYFSYTSGTGNGSTQNASATKKSYYTVSETADAWQRTYHISGSETGSPYFTHTIPSNAPTGTPLPYVVNTTEDTSSSQWMFVKTNLSAEEIEEAQLAFKAYEDIKANTSSYTTKMTAFFTDASCSELLPEYQSLSDEELRSQFEAQGLPEYLLRIALKVKNDTWANEDEMSKDFRVNKYQVYSHYLWSKNKVGMGYWFGRLSNPTGIVVKPGDILTVFCDQGAPSGCQLQLEYVQGTNAEGETLNLSKGINIFSFSEEATLFVFYQTNDTQVNTKLANSPDVRIHFEGGHLNGYYDKTRGHDNATWAHLRKNLLKQSNVINIKTKNFVFCMNNELVQKACATDMELLLKEWDMIGDAEDELMGYNDTFIPGLSEVQRNIFNCFSTTSGEYMCANHNGTYYLEGTLATIMNPKEMADGGIWGPAHENGHLRQYLILMLGTLESSNNLFSNVAVYKQGRTTQRGAAPATIFDHFANKIDWSQYDIWETTHMLYQLYLYFHVNGVMPDFYPRVFSKLRQDPMNRTLKTTIASTQEYHKFARFCCDVAQADLSEFFASYGFFVPVTFGSYELGSYIVENTQEYIDETLAYMHQFPKKLGNILFIEDRVAPVPATYEGHKEGEMKKRRSDDALNGQPAGDVGQYGDYLLEPVLVDAFYTVGATGDVKVQYREAQSLVGFKVYDADGNLAFVSNTLSFTLPYSIYKHDYKIYAAMGDGSDILLTTDIPEGIDMTLLPATTSTKGKREGLFDLQGRPVLYPTKGSIYMQGGKKRVY